MKECKKHRVRDNKFGVTWCINCGYLFSKPCDVPLQWHEIKFNYEIITNEKQNRNISFIWRERKS